MNQLDKRDWVCTQPFNFTELFDHKTFMCCPNWLPVNLGDPMSIETNWKSDIAEQVRESMLDGSYKFCIESRCPKLTGLKEGKTHGFVSKEEFLKNRNKYDFIFEQPMIIGEIIIVKKTFFGRQIQKIRNRFR